MHVTLVQVQVKPDAVDGFIEACRLNHEASTQEAGNVRFDVLQLEEDPTHFVLYEAYADQDAAAAHKQTSHYQRWRDTVDDMMAAPRQGIRYHGLYPAPA